MIGGQFYTAVIGQFYAALDNIAEFKEVYDLGTIISNDDIELIYLEDGKTGGAEIDRLHRITA